MSRFQSNCTLILSLALYCVLWFVLHPYLGYRLDSDCTAYLSIADEVAKGNLARSINGLWSPLNSWLMVPFIKMGYNTWLIAKCLNCFIGACVLVVFRQILIRKKTSSILEFSIMCILPIILVYYSYLQIVGDLLQVLFLLLYYYCITSFSFFQKTSYVLLAAVFIILAYYAKAYSLFFFVLHFAATCYLYYKQKIISKQVAVKKYIFMLGLVILAILPWSYMLHKKYNVWTLMGNAGALNMSWNINSGKEFKKEITLLIPPTYNNSVSFWEDPYPSQGTLYNPFSSPVFFAKWIARVLHTCFVAITCLTEISFISIAFILFCMYYFFVFKKNNLKTKIGLAAILCISIGYITMHIETRYIWLVTFMLLLISATWFKEIITANKQSVTIKTVHLYTAFIIFYISFCTFPIYNMWQLKNVNKNLFEINKEIKMPSSFTSNATDAGNMWVVAYLQHQSFYTIEKTTYTTSELVLDMKRYRVQYYIHTLENKNPEIENSKEFTKVQSLSNGWEVYLLN